MFTKTLCLAHYTNDKETMFTTEARKTGLGITQWQKQDNGEIVTMACDSRYLSDTEKCLIGEVELLTVVS